MRVAVCNKALGRVENIVEVADLATAAAIWPDRDVVAMVEDTHPAEPGAAYDRRAAVCRFTRGDGQTIDTPRARARIGTQP